MPGTLTKCPACGALANPSWMTCGACTKPLNGQPKPAPPMVQPGASPIRPGWFIAWKDSHGQLVGGPEDQRNGQVVACRQTLSGWTVEVSSSATVPERAIFSIAETDPDGRVVAAWTTRERGLTGQPRRATSAEWLTAWRELASQTAGLLPDDPRLALVVEGLGCCDEAFLANDYPRFLQAKAQVLRLMTGERRTCRE